MSDQTIVELNSAGKCILNKNEPSAEINHSMLSDLFMNVITREEVEDLVKQSVSPDAELIDYELKPCSEEKLGFMGFHLCLVVVTRRPDHVEHETRSFFVKTLPHDVPTQVAFIRETGGFRKEVEFFRRIAPLLTKNFKGESWAPKCYLAKDDVIVLEDLKSKGFSNRAKSLNESSVEAALACIARFHASSLLAVEQMTDEKSLKDIFPDLLKGSDLLKRNGRTYSWYSVAIDLAVSLANELGLDSSNIRRASECIFEIVESETKHNVVSHSDLWSNNLMFDEEGRCNLVDFQVIRYAPLAHDVMYFLYLSTSKDFRRKHERQMIEHYYKILVETLKDNHFESEVPTFMELLQGAEEQRLSAVVFAMILHPTVLMDKKIAAKIMSDPITFESYTFIDKKPFVRENMASNVEYEKKIKEDVRELVEMSLIVDSLPKPM